MYLVVVLFVTNLYVIKEMEVTFFVKFMKAMSLWSVLIGLYNIRVVGPNALS